MVLPGGSIAVCRRGLLGVIPLVAAVDVSGRQMERYGGV